jgi:hypothetical protein
MYGNQRLVFGRQYELWATSVHNACLDVVRYPRREDGLMPKRFHATDAQPDEGETLKEKCGHLK